MVRLAGIEPATTAMSRRCSTTELKTQIGAAFAAASGQAITFHLIPLSNRGRLPARHLVLPVGLEPTITPCKGDAFAAKLRERKLGAGVGNRTL